MNVLAFVHLRNIHRSTGAGRVARELIENVAFHRSVNLRVLADTGDHAAIIPKVSQIWKNFPYHLFKSDTSWQQAKWLALRSPKAESFWPEAEIVHCTGESYVPTKNARLIVTAHDAAYFDKGAHAVSFGNMKQAAKWRYLFHVLEQKVDLFHTVSQFSAERLAVAFPQIKSRLRVIYNGVSQCFFDTSNGQEDEPYLQQVGAGNRPYILFPGGLHFRKNADLLFKVWPILAARNPDLMLVVSGHSDPAYRAAADVLGKAVIHTGFLEDFELRALYRNAVAVWFPSRYEGFGLPPLEAMASGTPVVASNTTSLPEVTGGCALLADPNSVDEHAERLQALIESSALREDLIVRGTRRAREFTWPLAGMRLQELYASVL